MKKNLTLLLLPFSFLITPFLQAHNCCYSTGDAHSCCNKDEMCFYAKVFSGPNFLQSTTVNQNQVSYQTGYVVAGSLGYFFQDGLHIEAEYAYRRNSISTIYFFGQGSSNNGYFQTSSCMGNLLWDLPLSNWGCSFWNIRPFIGAGVGCDFQHMHASNSRINFNQSWTHFSWQVMTGLVFPIFRNTELTLEYKFHQGGSHFNNQCVGLGLIYKFGYLR